MKLLVTYYSMTGNTRKVAESIYNALPGEKSIAPVDQVSSVQDFTVVFLGFPITQFGVPRPAMNFIRNYLAGIPVALFVTHAIISESTDLIQRTMLEKELDKCRSACSDAILKGLFHCQGELSEQMARDLIETNIPMLRGFAQMRPLTLGHPDPEELDRAASFAREICQSL